MCSLLWRAPHPPCRLPPGQSTGGTMRLKTILIAVAVVAVSFLVSLKAMDWLLPRGGNAPKLVELPQLPQVPRTSTIIAPVAVTLNAIRDAADRGTPRNFAGKAANPVEQILQNAD